MQPSYNVEKANTYAFQIEQQRRQEAEKRKIEESERIVREKKEKQDNTISELTNFIQNVYGRADQRIDWNEMVLSNKPYGGLTDEEWEYLHNRAEKVLNGDIDTYFDLLSSINPFNDLQEYGSNFQLGTDDPRMIAVQFDVNSNRVVKESNSIPQNEYNLLLQDYVCGSSIRIARDVFALLPLRWIIVDAIDENKLILSVKFPYDEFNKLDFGNMDASNAIEGFENKMAFSPENGFMKIDSID